MRLPLRVILAIALGAVSVLGEDRIWVEVRVDGRPARIFFDTAASHTVLFRKAADRLGLRYRTPPPETSPFSSSSINAALSDECDFSLPGTTVRTKLWVVDLPQYISSQSDGALGWGSIRKSIIRIDAGDDNLETLSEVPQGTKSWTPLRLVTNSSILTVYLPSNGRTNLLVIDSGLKGGVFLSPELWKKWELAHLHQKSTLSAVFMHNAGTFIREEVWADEIAIGSLVLKNVPVTEAHPVQITSPSFEAAFGLTALKQLEMVIDGGKGIAYFNTNNQTQSSYEHNRLGAVFVPKDAQKDDDLVAHVAIGSPAQRAGVQNGDILLRIGELDVTKWRTNPTILPLSRYWERPKGTEHRLILRRGHGTNEVIVILEDILCSDSPVEPGRLQ